MPSPPPARIALITATAVAVAFGTSFLWLRHSASRLPAPPRDAHASAKPKPPPPVPLPVVQHEMAEEYSQLITNPNQSPESRIGNVLSVLELYRQACGGMPGGHNEIIVSSILGSNEKNVQLLPGNSPAIQRGELVDEWGTPYWFHGMTDRDVEIRSAGPDRDLFTSDDITSHPGAGS